jgi:hypothetical protein
VTLNDANSNPVSGKAVTLAKTSGSGSPTITTSQGTTDGSGHATFTVASSTPATDVFTATDTTDSVTVTATATVTFTAQPVVSAAALLNFFQNGSYSVSSPDGNGAYWNNITGGLGNYGTGFDSIVNNGGSGATSVALLATNDSSPGWSLSISNTVSGGLNGDTGQGDISTPYSNNLTAIWPLTALEDGATIQGVGVYLTGLDPSKTYTVYLYGNNVSGSWDTVGQNNTLATYGTFTGTTTVNFPDVKNNTNTYAEWDNITPTAGGVIAINVAPTSNFGALNAIKVVEYSVPVPADAGNSTVAASPTAVTADGSTTSTITVTLKDGSSSPLSGKTVTLAQTSGSGSPTITTTQGTTDGSGHATFTVASATAAVDVFTATDTTDGVTVSQTATVTFTGPPVAVPMTVYRTAGLSLLISLADVATNWSDPNGYTVSLAGINLVTTNGVNLQTNSSWILYTNSPNVADQISYSIADSNGGTNIGLINIVINSSVTGTNSIASIVIGSGATSGSNWLTAYGIPGYSYVLERATSLSQPVVWTDISTNEAAPNGAINVIDSNPPQAGAFYQLKWQP